MIVGKGRRLFEGDGLAAEFELQSSHTTRNGVLALVYRPKKGMSPYELRHLGRASMERARA